MPFVEPCSTCSQGYICTSVQCTDMLSSMRPNITSSVILVHTVHTNDKQLQFGGRVISQKSFAAMQDKLPTLLNDHVRCLLEPLHFSSQLEIWQVLLCATFPGRHAFLVLLSNCIQCQTPGGNRHPAFQYRYDDYTTSDRHH